MEVENGQNGRKFVMDLERYGITGIMEGIHWPVATYSRGLLARVPNIEVKILCASLIGLRLMTGVKNSGSTSDVSKLCLSEGQTQKRKY
jgi:hypothetical protein